MFLMQSNHNFVKYSRFLGWEEYNEEEEAYKDVCIVVVDANVGYNVFRDGAFMQVIQWEFELEDALECAVERVQYEHANHEILNEKGNI